VILVLAVGTGLAVANIYYSQPLLAPIGSGFGVSQGSTTLVVTLTQLGYALGLVVLLPLGDFDLPRRRRSHRGVRGRERQVRLDGRVAGRRRPRAHRGVRGAVSTLSQVRAEAAAGREIAA
jgi:MFS family permease